MNNFNIDNEYFKKNIVLRKINGIIFKYSLIIITMFSILLLFILLYTIVDKTMGYVVVTYKNSPSDIEKVMGKNINNLSKKDLAFLIDKNINPRLKRFLTKDKELFFYEKSKLLDIFKEEIIAEEVEKIYNLSSSLLKRNEIFSSIQEGEFVYFRFWINKDFLLKAQSSNPLKAGIKGAIIGTIWIVFLTLIISIPLGVGTAIFIEEFIEKENFIFNIIKINIYNLSGIPSIIYGLFGLFIFVRTLSYFTSGAFMGIAELNASGRTILSAGITMSILILPIIIINTQEAIKSVPNSLKNASYGLGATKIQTIFYHILPYSIDRILTGLILGFSRAIGETAPLVVIGASTFLTTNPKNIFDKFTVLPIQIYQWTARPQEEYKFLAASAIVILLLLLFLLNAFAITLRNDIRKKKII